MTTRSIALVLLAAAAVAAPRPAGAQAWGPGAGEASVYLGYSSTLNRYHYLSTGEELDRGRTTVNVVAADITYGLTDRVALRLGIPYVRSRYEGAFPHNTPGHELIDDGQAHGSFTDAQLEIRYMALDGPLAVTPFVSGGAPVGDYEQHGHSAAGRQLTTAALGLNVGWRPVKLLPNAYTQGRYGFTLAEKIRGVSHNWSSVDLQVGYFVTSAVSARVGSHWVIGHGGVDQPVPRTHPLFEVHDQIGDEHSHNMSVGLSWSLGPSIDIHATGLRSLSGKNGHKIDRTIGIGVSYSFSPGSPFGGRSPSVVSNTP